jgi:hypothetical protein
MAYHAPMNQAGSQIGSVDTDVIVAGCGRIGGSDRGRRRWADRGAP